jgi:SAM-dependent methyltransferase
MPPGRALDLGCGAGRNALYLAAHGWDTVGVEMVRYAVEVATRTATARALPARFLEGEVTRLAELAIGDDFTLLMDGGCYHMIPANRRDAYADGVTMVAAPGARLIMVGFSHLLGTGMQRDELTSRLRGWRLVGVDPVPGAQMRDYVSGPAVLRAVLNRGAFHPLRYEFVREPR